MILQDSASELARLDRYERRALSRRKSAIREFDATRALTKLHIALCFICARKLPHFGKTNPIRRAAIA
jgi:hypothetical protein